MNAINLAEFIIAGQGAGMLLQAQILSWLAVVVGFGLIGLVGLQCAVLYQKYRKVKHEADSNVA